jgi:inosine-uridine nucleoside N-ribohydrolase
MYGDVETEGVLTYGATVFDRRRNRESRPNMDVVVEMDIEAVTGHILERLTKAA